MAEKGRGPYGGGSIHRIKGRQGFRAQVRLSDGRMRQKQVPTLAAGQAWIKEQFALDLVGEHRVSSKRTLDEWADEWFSRRAEHVAPQTLANERSHYRNYFGPLATRRLDRLTTGAIRDWLRSIERGAGVRGSKPGRPHTARLCYSLLTVMLRDAVGHELLLVNPMSSLPRPRVPPPSPKYLTRTETDRLLEAVTASGDPRAVGVHLMLRLGLRRNEALGLTWAEVDLERGMVNVVAQLGRKRTGADGNSVLERRELKTAASRRRLALAGDLVPILEHLCGAAVRLGSGSYVVSFGDGLPVDPDAFSRWLRKVGQQVGVKVSPHRLRHTTATLMLNDGVAIEAVGKVLGHTDVKTTSIYARVLDETGAEALRTLARGLDDHHSPSDERDT